VTAQIAAGVYTQGSSSLAASAGTPVSNQSTLTHPQVIGHWAWPAFEQVQADFLLEAVCFHRSAQNAKPVAAVVFTVTDQHSNTVTQTVTDMTVSTRGGDANPVLVYAATIPISSFTQGDVLNCNFKAYPWVGDSGATVDSNNGITPPDERLCPHLLLCDKSATYGGAFAVIDATNGHASTASTWVAATQAAAEAAYVSSTANSYATIGDALVALKAFNNATYGRNNPGGATMLLSGSHSWPGNGPVDQGAQDTWTTITRLSTVSRATAQLNAGSNNPLSCRRTKLYDVTVSGSSVGQIHGTLTTDVLWIDNCDINNTSASSIYQWALTYGTRCSITQLGSGWSAFSTSKSPPGLVRGNTYLTTTDRGVKTDVYCVIGNAGVYPNFVGVGNNAGSQQISDGAIWAFNTSLRQDGTIIDTIAAQQWSQGFALVQSIFEKKTTVSVLGAIIADGCSATSSNVILWHNVFAGDRTNCGYNDTGPTGYLHKCWSQRGNIHDLWNNKDDQWTGGSGGDGNRTGSWPVGYNVGSHSNHRRASNGDGVGLPGEFTGLWTINGGTWAFVGDASNDAGGGGSGLGGGDYHLRPAASFDQPTVTTTATMIRRVGKTSPPP
jgi:hypothetical protein